MQNVSVLIPYRQDFGPRDQVFKWIQKFYEKFMPETEICIGECNTELFSRSQAINNASKKATRDIFVVVDGDIFYDPNIIKQSINLLERFAWIIPYHRIHYIGEETTSRILGLEPELPIPINIDLGLRTLDATIDITVGGMNILPKKNFEIVQGFDERFCGWGAEDEAFERAVNTLCGGYARVNTDIYHLYHPRDENPRYAKNRALYLEYVAATGNRKKIQELINER